MYTKWNHLKALLKKDTRINTINPNTGNTESIVLPGVDIENILTGVDKKTDKQIFFLDSNVLGYYEKEKDIQNVYRRYPYRSIHSHEADFLPVDETSFKRTDQVKKEFPIFSQYSRFHVHATLSAALNIDRIHDSLRSVNAQMLWYHTAWRIRLASKHLSCGSVSFKCQFFTVQRLSA